MRYGQVVLMKKLKYILILGLLLQLLYTMTNRADGRTVRSVHIVSGRIT